MLQKIYHEHFLVVYTMKLSWNTYFMKCSERNISQCILALRPVSPQHFVYDFFKKSVSHVIFYEQTEYNCLTACFLEICFLGNMWIISICFSMQFAMSWHFSWPKCQNKNLNIFKTQERLINRWKKKYFSSYLKSFHMPEIVSDLRVHL